jgi:hypothetical protein
MDMPTKPLIVAAVLLVAALPASQAIAKPNGMPYMGGPDNFGEANRETMAAQIVDPNPVYADAVPASSAGRAGHAVERYRTDKVKKPERLRTSNSSVGGGGGAGVSSGGGEGGS